MDSLNKAFLFLKALKHYEQVINTLISTMVGTDIDPIKYRGILAKLLTNSTNVNSLSNVEFTDILLLATLGLQHLSKETIRNALESINIYNNLIWENN